MQATHSVGCCYGSPSKLINIPWQITYAGPCPNLQQSSEIHRDLDMNLVYLYCSPVSSGAPEKQGSDPLHLLPRPQRRGTTRSHPGRASGSPSGQIRGPPCGQHLTLRRSEPGATWVCRAIPQGSHLSSHWGSPSSGCQRQAAAPHNASASLSHCGSETLPPAPISNSLYYDNPWFLSLSPSSLL